MIEPDRLCASAQAILLIRGVWRQVRVYASEYGDAFEGYTKLVYV